MKSLSAGARWMRSVARWAAWIAAAPRRAAGGGGRLAALGLDEVEDGALGLGAGQRERDVEQEAVELRLGQREGALVLDRVLGGDHHEGVGQRTGDAAGGDLALGHRLEQGRLHLGRRAVDLVDEDEAVEERAGEEVEAGVVGAEDLGAGHVGRHQVGRALDAGEAGVEAGGERLDRAGLGEAGRALDQEVAAGEHADREPLDQPLVADEAGRDGLGEARDGREGIGDPCRCSVTPSSPIDLTGGRVARRRAAVATGWGSDFRGRGRAAGTRVLDGRGGHAVARLSHACDSSSVALILFAYTWRGNSLFIPVNGRASGARAALRVLSGAGPAVRHRPVCPAPCGGSAVEKSLPHSETTGRSEKERLCADNPGCSLTILKGSTATFRRPVVVSLQPVRGFRMTLNDGLTENEKIDALVRTRAREAMRRAASAGLPLDETFTEDSVLEVRQAGYRCAITGRAFDINCRTAGAGGTHYAPSPDRIIPDRGYVRGNVQWIFMVLESGQGRDVG